MPFGAHIFTFSLSLCFFGETQHGATVFFALFAKDFICRAHCEQQMTRHLRMTTDLLSLERDVECIPCDDNGGSFYIGTAENKTRMSLLFSMFSIGSFTYSISNNGGMHTPTTAATIVILNSRCSITCH